MPLPLALLLAYLWGAIPTAYLVARWRRGVDLRRFGSGSVGGSNVSQAVGPVAGTLVGVADIAKGAAPVLLARLSGWDITAAGVVGLAAVLGHDWSIYLRLAGGRGLGATLGVLLVIAPWACLLIVAGMIIGRLIHRSALAAGLGLLLVPLVALALPVLAPPVSILAALVAVAVLKRLLANGRPAGDLNYSNVLLNRVLYDRDVGQG